MVEKKEEKTENKDDKSDLEKDVELAEEQSPEAVQSHAEDVDINIDKNKFREFVIPNSSKISVALEKVAEAPEQPIVHLESELPETFKEDKKDDKFYNAITYEDDKEKSYSEKQEPQSQDFVMKNSGAASGRDITQNIKVSSRQDFQFSPELQGTKKPEDDYINFKPSGEDFTKTKPHDTFQQDVKKDYEFR